MTNNKIIMYGFSSLVYVILSALIIFGSTLPSNILLWVVYLFIWVGMFLITFCLFDSRVLSVMRSRGRNISFIYSFIWDSFIVALLFYYGHKMSAILWALSFLYELYIYYPLEVWRKYVK